MPDSLVSWWTFDGHKLDVLNEDATTTAYGVEFAEGVSGLGLEFDYNDFLVVGDYAPTNLGAGPGFTIEGWILRSSEDSFGPLMIWWNDQIDGTPSLSLWVNSPGTIEACLFNDKGARYVVSSPPVSLRTNTFQHLALTYDRATRRVEIYLDGQELVSTPIGTFGIRNPRQLSMGGYGSGSSPNTSFAGVLDEISIYDRALPPEEIARIHAAQPGSKCPTAMLPIIRDGPQDQTILEGGTATFVVRGAGGNLSYQWYEDGVAMENQTLRELVLTNLDASHSGSWFSVVVSNDVGSAESEAAALTVLVFPDCPDSMDCLPMPDSLVSWWTFDGHTLDVLNPGDEVYDSDTDFADGVSGMGLNFDNHDILAVQNYNRSQLGWGPGFTIEGWFRGASESSAGPLAMWWSDYVGGTVGAGLWVSHSGGIAAYLHDEDETLHSVQGVSAALDASEFHHAALTYERALGRVVLYLDGLEQISTNIGPVNILNARHLTIGGHHTTCCIGSYFTGVIDEVSIYDRALPAEEIGRIHAAQPGGKIHHSTPPVVRDAPMDAEVAEGGTAVFVVRGAGGPLSYQWYKDGIAMENENSRELVLEEVGLQLSGARFSVVLSNALGSVESAAGELSVQPFPPCAMSPPNLVGWWTLDGDGRDEVSGLEPLLVGEPDFHAGLAGESMTWDGVDDALVFPVAPELDPWNPDGFTIECWIHPDTLAIAPLFHWRSDEESRAPAVWISVEGRLYVDLLPRFAGSEYWTPPGTIRAGEFQHVAVTFDLGSRWSKAFWNGVEVGSARLYPNAVDYLESGPLSVGSYLDRYRFAGEMDELAVYSRALSEAELMRIHEARSSGQCRLVASHPQSLVVFEGQAASFTVSAPGPGPFTYQWLFNGEIIQGGNSERLSLDQVSLAQSGHYAVLVSDGAGRADRSSATLTVLTSESRLTLIEVAPGQPVRLSLSGTPGVVHLIEGSLDLVRWDSIGVARELGEGLFEFVGPPAEAGWRFYRGVVSP